jgi:hypothetical protein
MLGGEFMKKKQLVIYLVVVVGILALGIGYAAIATQGFTINGNLSSDVDTDQFKVKFTGTPLTNIGTTNATMSATIDSSDSTSRTATLNVSGLKARGETVTATYTIINDSSDLTANLGTPTVTNNNPTYFNVTATYGANGDTILAGNTTTIIVTVELLKTPIDTADNLTSTTKVTFDATPSHP